MPTVDFDVYDPYEVEPGRVMDLIQEFIDLETAHRKAVAEFMENFGVISWLKDNCAGVDFKEDRIPLHWILDTRLTRKCGRNVWVPDDKTIQGKVILKSYADLPKPQDMRKYVGRIGVDILIRSGIAHRGYFFRENGRTVLMATKDTKPEALDNCRKLKPSEFYALIGQ